MQKRFTILWLLHSRTIIAGVLVFLGCTVLGLTLLLNQENQQPPQEPQPQEFADEYLYRPLPVNHIPEGYLPFDAAKEEETYGVLHYSFLETHIFLSDCNGDLILSGPVSDGKLIVDHEGKHYVNGDVHRSAVEQSEQLLTKQAAPYQIGDWVPLRRSPAQYNIIIQSVEHNIIQAVLTDFGIRSHTDCSLLPYFVRVETKKGQAIAAFSEEENGTLTVPLTPGDEIARIILKNPDRPAVMRTVLVLPASGSD